MDNNPPPILRRRFVVKKRLQYYFAAASWLSILGTSSGVWLVMDHIAIKNGAPFMLYSQLAICTFILAYSAAAFILSILFSHFVAGPIYRIEKTLVEMTEGKRVAPIKFRKYDLLQETGDILNTLIADWNKRPPKK
jgi:hypothetical protein